MTGEIEGRRITFSFAKRHQTKPGVADVVYKSLGLHIKFIASSDISEIVCDNLTPLKLFEFQYD